MLRLLLAALLAAVLPSQSRTLVDSQPFMLNGRPAVRCTWSDSSKSVSVLGGDGVGVLGGDLCPDCKPTINVQGLGGIAPLTGQWQVTERTDGGCDLLLVPPWAVCVPVDPPCTISILLMFRLTPNSGSWAQIVVGNTVVTLVDGGTMDTSYVIKRFSTCGEEFLPVPIYILIHTGPDTVLKTVTVVGGCAACIPAIPD